MQLPRLTTTNLRRYNNILFMLKEFVSSEKIDLYQSISDSLLIVIYGIEDVIEELEKLEFEERLKRNQ